MAVAKNIGQGWHFQPIRHSNARRFGHAGGIYAPRGSLPSDVIASDSYYDREEAKYGNHVKPISREQVQNILDHLNDVNNTSVKIRYLNQDEPNIFTQGNTIYTTPHTLLTPLGVAHEYAHTVSSPESTHDAEFENNLEKVVGELPRKYGRPASMKTIIKRAKLPVERSLAKAILLEKNSKKKEELTKILLELERSDSKSSLKKWYLTHGENLKTLGISVPLAVFAPLMLGGAILAMGMGVGDASKTVPQMGMFGIVSASGALATRGTIQNMGIVKRKRRSLYLDTLEKLQDRKDLTARQKSLIAKRVSDELTIETVPEVKEINEGIQRRMFTKTPKSI